MEYNQDKVDEVALALIYLNCDSDSEAWKDIAWSVTDRLHAKGYIYHPGSHQRKLIFTKKGATRSRELFLKHFTDQEVELTPLAPAVILEHNSNINYNFDLLLYELEYAFEEDDCRKQSFLNLQTGEIVSSFPAALTGGPWLLVSQLKNQDWVEAFRDFIKTVQNDKAHSWIEQSLHMGNPVKSFYNRIRRYPEEEQRWRHYKREFVQKRIFTWLKANRITLKEENCPGVSGHKYES